MKRQTLKYYIAGSISLMSFVVYLSSLRNNFVEWDDDVYVFNNPFIRAFNVEFFKKAFCDFYASNWHPLTWISHALDYAVWGLNPLGHHFSNNILHAANTFIVVSLVANLLDAGRYRNEESLQFFTRNSQFTLISAGMTGLLFGLHPLHVESVAWVAERKDLLCALFFLLSILTYTQYANKTFASFQLDGLKRLSAQAPIENISLKIGRGHTASRKSGPQFFNKQYLVALFFFILALLSKPMAVSLPLVLLILDWYPFKRVDSLKTLQVAFTEKLPFIALSFCLSILTILAQKAGGAMTITEYVPLPIRILVAANSLFAYVWKMLVPFHLIPFYPYPKDITILSLTYLFPAVLVIGITTICLGVARKQRLWISVWSYYVVTLLPVLGILQVGSQSMADRYTYLPSLGPFFIAGVITAEIYKRLTALKRWRFVLRIGCSASAIVILLFMSYLTLKQIGVWKDGLTLWNYVIKEEPLKVPQAYNNLGFILLGKGLIDEAVDHFQIAIQLDPGYADAYNNLCLAYKTKGLFDKAIEQCRTAVSKKPNYAVAHNNLGVVYGNKGMYDKAVEEYLIALKLKPDYAEALFNLGIVYLEKGNMDMARRSFEAGLRIRPDDEKAQQVLNDIISK